MAAVQPDTVQDYSKVSPILLSRPRSLVNVHKVADLVVSILPHHTELCDLPGDSTTHASAYITPLSQNAISRSLSAVPSDTSCYQSLKFLCCICLLPTLSGYTGSLMEGTELDTQELQMGRRQLCMYVQKCSRAKRDLNPGLPSLSLAL